MIAIRRWAAPLAGLFVEDGSLALAILALVGGVALLRLGFELDSLAAGGLLLAGPLALLVENVIRSNRGR
jgi:hypothetical protein